MKVKIWYTLYEGGKWIEAEIDSEIYKYGCVIFSPAICIDESLLPPEVKRGRSLQRFYINGIDTPVHTFTLADPRSKEYKRSKDAYDACLMLSPDVISIIVRNILRHHKLIPWENKTNEDKSDKET